MYDPPQTKFLVLGGAPLEYPTRAETQAAVARYVALAVTSGRLPVFPHVPCHSKWITRNAHAYQVTCTIHPTCCSCRVPPSNI
jgi:hypothetical protein